MTVPPSQAQPGDIVLAHSTGIIGKGIRLAEWLRWRKGSNWNHVAVVVGADPMGNPLIAQATGHGVKLGRLSDVSPGGVCEIRRCPDGVDGAKVAAYARSRVGVEYGFLTIVAILFDILTPNFFRVDFRRDGTLICSALGALALMNGGWLYPVRDYYQWTPAQMSEALA